MPHFSFFFVCVLRTRFIEMDDLLEVVLEVWMQEDLLASTTLRHALLEGCVSLAWKG